MIRHGVHPGVLAGVTMIYLAALILLLTVFADPARYEIVPVHGRDLTGRSDECATVRRDGRSLGVYCRTSEDF